MYNQERRDKIEDNLFTVAVYVYFALWAGYIALAIFSGFIFLASYGMVNLFWK